MDFKVLLRDPGSKRWRAFFTVRVSLAFALLLYVSLPLLVSVDDSELLFSLLLELMERLHGE